MERKKSSFGCAMSSISRFIRIMKRISREVIMKLEFNSEFSSVILEHKKRLETGR